MRPRVRLPSPFPEHSLPCKLSHQPPAHSLGYVWSEKSWSDPAKQTCFPTLDAFLGIWVSVWKLVWYKCSSIHTSPHMPQNLTAKDIPSGCCSSSNPAKSNHRASPKPLYKHPCSEVFVHVWFLKILLSCSADTIQLCWVMQSALFWGGNSRF